MNLLYFLVLPNCKECIHYIPHPIRRANFWRCGKFNKFAETCRETSLCGLNGTHFEHVV